MCPLCNGLLVFLGILGSRAWLRCEDCGMELSGAINDYIEEDSVKEFSDD